MARIELHPDFRDFLRLLNSHGVEYLLREVVDVDGIPVPFISLADLKANKRACGGHKDLEDLEHLRPGPSDK